MYCDFPSLKRCCFCLPLRRGVISFGYINIVFSVIMISAYSYTFARYPYHDMHLVYHGTTQNTMGELCIAVYCAEFIANCVLVYGGHRKNLLCLNIFFYFTITTMLAGVLVQIKDFFVIYNYIYYRAFVTLVLCFSGICIQLYLVIAVRSLVKKLESSDPQEFDNQFHMVLSGKTSNEACNDNAVTEPINDVVYA